MTDSEKLQFIKGLERALEVAYNTHYSLGPKGKCNHDDSPEMVGEHNQTLKITSVIESEIRRIK